MPNKARNHEESRKVVCLLCFGKTRNMRGISARVESIIRENILSGFDSDDIRLPTVLCSNCNTIVCEYGRQNFIHSITLFDHSSLTDRVSRSSSSSSCQCKVCDCARSSTSSNLSNSSTIMVKKKPGPAAPLNPTPNKRESIKICSNCFFVIGRGKQHICSARKRHHNLLDIASGSSTKELIASSVINEKESVDDAIPLTADNGKTMKLIRSPPSTSRCSLQQLSSNDIHKMQTDMNLSTNQTHVLCKHIRSSSGSRNVIESNVKERLREKNHRLDNHFIVENHTFWKSRPDSVSSSANSSVVFCDSLESLLETVIVDRNYTSDVRCTIGIDSGGEFLKISLTVQSSVSATNEEKGRRKLHELSCVTFKDTGVKRLFILGVVKDVSENYQNILAMWNILNLTRNHDFLTMLDCTYAMDMKMANIMLGLMAHSSSHPCSWCNIHKNDLKNKGELRTLGSIRSMFWKFTEKGRKSSQAKNNENVIHPPIFKNTDETTVLDIIPPPQLHLLLGSVNTLYMALTKCWPDSMKWTEAINVSREAYHGGCFTGNSCRKILRRIDDLENMSPVSCKPIIDAFRALNDVVVSCFSSDLSSDYMIKIDNFKSAYMRLGINVTPKIHTIIYHIPDFCENHHVGLGCYSEQSFESVHTDFMDTWNKYKVNDNHENFAQHLLRAVREYNSRHL